MVMKLLNYYNNLNITFNYFVNGPGQDVKPKNFINLLVGRVSLMKGIN
jgi:hypothetical protein